MENHPGTAEFPTKHLQKPPFRWGISALTGGPPKMGELAMAMVNSDLETTEPFP